MVKLEPLRKVLRWGYFRFNDICVIHSSQVENKSHPQTASRKPKECFFPTSEPDTSMINRSPCLIHFTDCFCMNENKNKNINSTHAKYPSSDCVTNANVPFYLNQICISYLSPLKAQTNTNLHFLCPLCAVHKGRERKSH